MKNFEKLRKIPLPLIFAVLIVFFLGLLKFPSFVLVIILGLATAVLVYFKARTQFPLEFTPTFFLSIAISNSFGFGHMLLYIFFALLLPQIMIFGIPDPLGFLFWINLILLNGVSIVIFALLHNFLILGLIMSVLEFGMACLLQSFFGRKFGEFIIFSILSFIVNIIYFTQLTKFAIIIFPLH